MKMRISMVIISLTSLLAVVQAGPARAADPDIVFDGAGWGHGVGMSQYGAQARALDGQSYADILSIYYPGTAKSALEADHPGFEEIFVNVGSDRTFTTLTVTNGPATPREGMVITRRNGADIEPSIVLSSGDRVEIEDMSPEPGNVGGCVFEFYHQGEAEAFGSWSEGKCEADVELHTGGGLPSQVITATNCRTSNCSFALGYELKIVDNGSPQRCIGDTCFYDKIGSSGCSTCPVYEGFDIVATMTLDDYVRGLKEVPFSWESAALEAQAVAARSYGSSFAVEGDPRREGCFCDVKNDSSYQVYGGWLEGATMWERWDAAAVATAGEVLTHDDAPDAGIVRAYYTSSNGGATESSLDRWGTAAPYLLSVPDDYSLLPPNPYASWDTVVKASTIVDKVWGTSFDGTLESVAVVARHTSGSAKTVRFVARDADGSITTELSGASVDLKFGLLSWYFDVDDSAIDLSPVYFDDIDDTVHKTEIEYLAELGAALACEDGDNLFCPKDPMRREDLAAFMVRVLDLPAASKDYFVDDDGLPFEDDINALARAGITKGCNPPANDRFCPDKTVTRGQTAAFIVRAWNLKDDGGGGWFTDTGGSVFVNDIDKLAVTGITKGCNPPDNDRYCPDRLLTRGEMSSFLARAHRSFELS